MSRSLEISSEAKQLEAELEKIDLTTLQPQAEFANDVLAQRNFSWTRLFNALETVLPWDVRLATVQPNFTSSGVLIDVAALGQDHDAFLHRGEQ